MHTIDLLEETLRLSSQAGWQVRHELLDGRTGGACRLGDRHLLFVDRSLTAAEQLEQVVVALRDYIQRPAHASEPFVARFTELVNTAPISRELHRCLTLRQSDSCLAGKAASIGRDR